MAGVISLPYFHSTIHYEQILTKLSRGVLLINDYQWKPAPIETSACEDGTASLVSIDFSTEYYDQKLIDFVEKDNHLAFASYYIDEENDHRINYLMEFDDIKTGLFIPVVNNRKAFLMPG